jgi:hypothetical protein
LAANKALYILILDRNDIHNEGATALSKNSNIQFLDVSYNHIGKIGIHNLENSSVQKVDVRGNDTEMGPRQSKTSKEKMCQEKQNGVCVKFIERQKK